MVAKALSESAEFASEFVPVFEQGWPHLLLELLFEQMGLFVRGLYIPVAVPEYLKQELCLGQH